MTLYNATQRNSSPAHILVPRGEDGFERRSAHPWGFLTSKIDLAFTRCSDKFGCHDMENRYRFTEDTQVHWENAKFVLDLEALTPHSMSFRELLLSGSLVLRSSLFQDFWVSQAKPWVN